MGGAGRWGVTVLQANAEMDAGDIWASEQLPLPRCSKSSVYRTEVADAALTSLLLAVARFDEGSYRPEPLDYRRPDVIGTRRPPCRQEHRRIDWLAEPTSWVLANLQAADSSPGVLDVIGGTGYCLFDGHVEDRLHGDPGAIVARRRGAPLAAPPGWRTYREISYRESAGVGYLEFCFPGGAMSTGQCRRLLAAYQHARACPLRVIVLGGPRDAFSNGIHLNLAAAEKMQPLSAYRDAELAVMRRNFFDPSEPYAQLRRAFV